MKKYFILSLISIFMIPILAFSQSAQQSSEVAKIRLVLEKYIRASETQDLELMESIWVNDESVVAFGTDVGERLQGWDELKKVYRRQFSTFRETYISARDQMIRLNDSGNTAWFSQILNYNFVLEGIAKKYEGIRFTGVMVKKGDHWKLVQIHLSLPQP